MSLDISFTALRRTVVGEFNITHNLTTMAEKLGVYQALWRPEELEITHAWELVPYLEYAIFELEVHPEYYAQWNASNGWGKVEDLLRLMKEVLKCCSNNMDAEIKSGG
jgi:hypothetical protein